jgi:hypothetical protein
VLAAARVRVRLIVGLEIGSAETDFFPFLVRFRLGIEKTRFSFQLKKAIRDSVSEVSMGPH